MSDPTDNPAPAVAVSPNDRSPDRPQADADQVASMAANRDDRNVSDAADSRAVSEREALRRQAAANQEALAAKIDLLIASNDRATEATAEVVAASRDQVAAADRFATAMVEYQERAKLAATRFRTTIRTLVVGFSVVTLLLLAGLITVVALVLINNSTASAARDTLLDCTVPTGKCAQRGAQAQGDAVRQLQKSDLINAVCAARYTDLPLETAITSTQACVAAVNSR